MKTIAKLLLVSAFLLALTGGALFAQDDPMTGTEVTLEEVTANSDTYYGQNVTLTGTIRNFLSGYSFVLAEDAVIDSDAVLVLNNSGQPLPPTFAEGVEVTITGRIHPSFDVVNNDPARRLPSYYEEVGGYSAVNTQSMDNTGSTEAQMTPEATPDPNMPTIDPAMVTPTAMTDAGMPHSGYTGSFWDVSRYDVDLLGWAYSDRMVEGFNAYTILELTDIRQVNEWAG